MRPSSSPSEPAARSEPAPSPEPAGLFDEVLARGRVRTAVADRAWLAALLEAEAALARAQAGLGLIPAPAAAAIDAACAPEKHDLGTLAAQAAGPGNPVLPLVRSLRAAVPDEFAENVHYGATAQDILDTGAMLIAYRALDPLLDDLAAAGAAAAALARTHRDTAMAGRTLLQQAMPTTFGLKAAGWLTALDTAGARLRKLQTTRLAVQLGGATGTLASFGEAGPALLDRYAAELGLAAPTVPWHTDRTRVAELTGALATAAGVAGKLARDLTLLAQSEVGEVTEAAGGASTAMPHKHNPIAAVAAAAGAAQAPGLAATLYAAMVQEHERAAGAWHAEWRPLRELLLCTGSAVAWLRESLAGLSVNEAAMAANLARLAEVAGLADPHAQLTTAATLVDRALATRQEVS